MYVRVMGYVLFFCLCDEVDVQVGIILGFCSYYFEGFVVEFDMVVVFWCWYVLFFELYWRYDDFDIILLDQ